MPWEGPGLDGVLDLDRLPGGADRIAGDGWVMAYFVEPLSEKVDSVHMLRLVGVVDLILGVVYLALRFS